MSYNKSELSHKSIYFSSSNLWGISSAGRALRWQRRGQRFDPAMLHHHYEKNILQLNTKKQTSIRLSSPLYLQQSFIITMIESQCNEKLYISEVNKLHFYALIPLWIISVSIKQETLHRNILFFQAPVCHLVFNAYKTPDQTYKASKKMHDTMISKESL